MKKFIAFSLLLITAAPSMGSMLYNDVFGQAPGPGGELFTGAGGGILDIVSLEVNNDATNISFKFTLNGDVEATDWGKYMLILDTDPGGNTTTNGWCRPISMASGADYWIGSWVDSGNGAELYSWTDGAGAFCSGWYQPETTYNAPPNNDISIVKSANTVTITTLLANMNLIPGDIVQLDGFSSGGGGSDGAVDSLGNPNQQIGDWGNASEAHAVSYTVKVPEPASLALLGLGALALIRRRR